MEYVELRISNKRNNLHNQWKGYYLINILEKNKEVRMNKEMSQGKIQQAEGKVKEEVGKITDDTPMVIKGKTEQVAGKIKEEYGNVKQNLK